MKQTRTHVAIVGAGIPGLICARLLSDQGLTVSVFEKSRGVGGRMATRRTTEGLRFDHGAQYFTVRDERFNRYTDAWMHDGIIKPWNGRICSLCNGDVQLKQPGTQRFVGIPTMNSVCRHLAKELDVQFRTKIAPPVFSNGLWKIANAEGQEFGSFDYLIIQHGSHANSL